MSTAIAVASQKHFEVHLAASRQLLALAGEVFERRFEIDGEAVLECANFDRVSYSRDLCGRARGDNPSLSLQLCNLSNQSDPDYVVSWSENRYLRRSFLRAQTLFMELGPLPRRGLRVAAFLDPFGHQTNCAITLRKRGEADEECSAFWQARWLMLVEKSARASGVTDWLAAIRSPFKNVMLVALQPPDWITYEGVGPDLSPLKLVEHVAELVGEGWLVVPQWHPGNALPEETALQDMTRRHPNIGVPPAVFRSNHSELFLPFVDGVATISSNVAAIAAILGKRVTVLGSSKFAALDTGSTPNPPERLDLLSFFLRQYCRPIDEWMSMPGAFADHLAGVLEPDWLASRDGYGPARWDGFIEPPEKPVVERRRENGFFRTAGPAKRRWT